AWFRAMEDRPSYRALAGDFYTHSHDLPPQVGGCQENGQNTDFRKAIDGESPAAGAAAWKLPLPTDGSASPLEPVGLLGGNGPEEAAAARREAARQLLSRHQKVGRFCLRGKGSRGFPPVGAGPLSDPYASPSDDADLAEAVDEALRGVVAHLLGGDGVPVAEAALGVLGPSAWKRSKDLSECLGYLRDRVSVPRDMSFPAARQLRAHLGSYMEAAETCAA
ncbi:unnamed protein product, partial [Polarella glacialis]